MMPKLGAENQAQVEGDLLGGAPLREALGFRTGEAFRAAARSGRLPIKLVKIEGRRGWFARAQDVKNWKAAVLARLGPFEAAGRSGDEDKN
ncbi:hypothetical protein [Ramlibacter sp.]|uniref:hypothetical protein n=1 Tax=Ramlibacter sp. TaxID=1917967 RepID=UPI0035B0318E